MDIRNSFIIWVISTKLLNIIEDDPWVQFLKSKLLSLDLFDRLKNSVGLSSKMYLVSLQTFYFQATFLIVTGYYLKRPTCKKMKSSQNKNGKPGLWSLNNFKAIEFTRITMHEYRAVIMKITANKFIYLHRFIGLSFVLSFPLTYFYIIQYIIWSISFKENARKSQQLWVILSIYFACLGAWRFHDGAGMSHE